MKLHTHRSGVARLGLLLALFIIPLIAAGLGAAPALASTTHSTGPCAPVRGYPACVDSISNITPGHSGPYRAGSSLWVKDTVELLQGVMVVQPQGKVRWTITKPGGKTYVFTRPYNGKPVRREITFSRKGAYKITAAYTPATESSHTGRSIYSASSTTWTFHVLPKKKYK